MPYLIGTILWFFLITQSFHELSTFEPNHPPSFRYSVSVLEANFVTVLYLFYLLLVFWYKERWKYALLTLVVLTIFIYFNLFVF